MTPFLQPFLSEMSAASQPGRVPMGTFTVARVSRGVSAPWSPSVRPAAAPVRAQERLPQGVVTAPRRAIVDMSRHATVVLS